MNVIPLERDLFSYDMLMSALQGLQQRVITYEPDVREYIVAKIRRSAEAYEVDLSAYEEFLE